MGKREAARAAAPEGSESVSGVVAGGVDVEACWEGGEVVVGCEEGQENQAEGVDEEEDRLGIGLLDATGGCCCSGSDFLVWSSWKKARNFATSGSTLLAWLCSLGSGGDCAGGEGALDALDAPELQNQPMMRPWV